MLEKNTIYQSKNMKRQVYVLVGMGHHALAWESTSLRIGSYGSMEEWRRGKVNSLRGEWSQGTHMGSIMIGSEGVI